MLYQLSYRIDEMSLRERILLVFSIAAVICMLLDMAFLRPLEVKKHSLSTKMISHQQQIQGIAERIEMLGRSNEEGGDLHVVGDLKLKNKALLETLSQLSDQVSVASDALQVMNAYTDLQNSEAVVVKIKNIPPVLISHNETHQVKVKVKVKEKDIDGAVMENRETEEVLASSDAIDGWYQHGLVSEIEGTPSALNAYIDSLNQVSNKMVWPMLLWTQQTAKSARVSILSTMVSNDPYWLKFEEQRIEKTL